MADDQLLDRVRAEIRQRLEDIRPLVREQNRLERALEALEELEPGAQRAAAGREASGAGRAAAAGSAGGGGPGAATSAGGAGSAGRLGSASGAGSAGAAGSSGGARRGGRAARGQRREELIQLVKGSPTLSIGEAARQMGISPSQASTLARRLEGEGVLGRQEGRLVFIAPAASRAGAQTTPGPADAPSPAGARGGAGAAAGAGGWSGGGEPAAPMPGELAGTPSSLGETIGPRGGAGGFGEAGDEVAFSWGAPGGAGGSPAAGEPEPGGSAGGAAERSWAGGGSSLFEPTGGVEGEFGRPETVGAPGESAGRAREPEADDPAGWAPRSGAGAEPEPWAHEPGPGAEPEPWAHEPGPGAEPDPWAREPGAGAEPDAWAGEPRAGGREGSAPDPHRRAPAEADEGLLAEEGVNEGASEMLDEPPPPPPSRRGRPWGGEPQR